VLVYLDMLACLWLVLKVVEEVSASREVDDRLSRVSEQSARDEAEEDRAGCVDLCPE
jgi:hypothetical protein